MVQGLGARIRGFGCGFHPWPCRPGAARSLVSHQSPASLLIVSHHSGDWRETVAPDWRETTGRRSISARRAPLSSPRGARYRPIRCARSRRLRPALHLRFWHKTVKARLFGIRQSKPDYLARDSQNLIMATHGTVTAKLWPVAELTRVSAGKFEGCAKSPSTQH